MDVITDLSNFYNEQAKYRAVTRKKHRPEFERVLAYVKNHPKKTLRIVELGCGDGRMYRMLKEQTNKELLYTGVDISKGLLGIAHQHSPDAQWLERPMEEYVQSLQVESVDLFISSASLQHLPTQELRIKTLDGIYMALVYGGVHITFNRAMSQWFRKKMKKQVWQALRKHIKTLGRRNRNDIMVPFSNPEKTKVYHRFYHMFTLKELQDLSKKV